MMLHPYMNVSWFFSTNHLKRRTKFKNQVSSIVKSPELFKQPELEYFKNKLLNIFLSQKP